MRPKTPLQRAAKQAQCVRIAREGSNLPHVYGFPIAVGPSLILLRHVADFDVDGFIVMPLRDIANVRSDNNERFLERVLSDEGQLGKRRAPTISLAVESWSGVFRALGAEREIVIVECERKDGEDFCIGVVTGVTDDSVGIHQFDAVADWDPAPTIVPFDDITHVRFGDRYTSVYAHYVADVSPT